MTLYKNKYRVEPARLYGYDYSSPGLYFVTICTKNRVHYFGNIIPVETPNLGVSVPHHSEDVVPGGTPNLGVSNPLCSIPTFKIQLSEIGQIADTYWNEIPEHFPNVKLDAFQIMPDHIHGIIQIMNTDKSCLPKNIGLIINQFKRICTIKSQNAGLEFALQPRFYDHIIRDEGELQRIRNYIENNPQNWMKDKFNIDCP